MSDGLIFWASVISVSVIIVGWGVNEHFKRDASKRQRLWELKLEKFMEARRILSSLSGLLNMKRRVVEQWKDDSRFNAAYYGGIFFYLCTEHSRVFQELGREVPDTFKSQDFFKKVMESPEDVIQGVYTATERVALESMGRLVSIADELRLISENDEVSSVIIATSDIFLTWQDDLPAEELKKQQKRLSKLSSKLTKAMRNELDSTLELRLLSRK